MFPMVTGFMNYGQQTIRAARYIGQSFIITLSHTNRLPVTIQYPYEKSIMSERFRGRMLIGDWKEILKRNNCFIIVLISGFVYFVVTVSSIVQQTVYQ